MTTVGSPRMRWVSLVGLAMLLMSITPFGVTAQVGLTQLGDVAQDGAALTGGGIELLLVDCPPGVSGDLQTLVPNCVDGRAGINIDVTSVDPALGIDQDKVSVKPSDPGPGVINTGVLPMGEYLVQINEPTDAYRFVFECGERTAGVTVSTSPAPNGAANAFVVENRAVNDVVCDVFLISTQEIENPTMEITYRECARADFPNDNRSFEDLQANCTDISTDPPTFSVRHLTEVGQPVTEHKVDTQGTLELSLDPGDFDIFTDLGMEDWGEYLFCEYEGQPRYEKDFHPERGITTFTNLLPGEELTCDWFGVSAAEEQAGVSEAPDMQDLTVEDPVADDQQGQGVQGQQQLLQTQQVGDVSFDITYKNCNRGDFPSDDRSLASLQEHCTYFEAPGPTFTIQEIDNSQTQQNLNATGVLNFTHAPESFSIYTNLDPDIWGEYLWCSFNDGPLYEKEFPIGGINSFSNLNAGEQFECFWFGVNANETPTEAPPVVNPDPVAPAQVANANFDLTLLACPLEADEFDTTSLEAFRANCTAGIENMIFNLVNQNDLHLTATTLPSGDADFAEVTDGDWRMWTEIPLHAATEFYFCSVDGAAYAPMQLSDRGVASFTGIDGQQINCEIYVVTDNLRGEQSGASVEIHLSACPVEYNGSSWYADCHDNGVDEMPFSLTGPAGEVSLNTSVERTPGPGIVQFTALPAGDYVLAGGPPQDFGSVFLYCSDPATNTQVPTRFENGMGYFTLAENQSIVCDWYFVPDDQGAPTVTPQPERAEILTTMFICPPGVNVAGSTFSQLDNACDQRLSDVPMTLQSPGGVPITANTGASGEGAIRFYDLTGGNYVLTPKLPTEYVSAAVYCDLDGVNVYQKALENGSTTFVNVDGDMISCSWFVTQKPQPAPGPTGSITVREMLCEEDRSAITDWERECQPGASGVTFTVTSVGGDVTQTVAPNAEGVAVFSGLPNEYYELVQSEGAWCRARAERVDAQSRIIVSGGGNTDVFIYQCNQTISLPDTGTGPVPGASAVPMTESLMLGAAALPLFAMAAWQIRRWQAASSPAQPIEVHEALTRTPGGYRYR